MHLLNCSNGLRYFYIRFNVIVQVTSDYIVSSQSTELVLDSVKNINQQLKEETKKKKKLHMYILKYK